MVGVHLTSLILTYTDLREHKPTLPEAELIVAFACLTVFYLIILGPRVNSSGGIECR
jgi:hypothetical protein